MANIFFIGPPLAGKSRVAQEVAQQLTMHFIDSDIEIERSSGESIPTIFAEHGEEKFRHLEHAIIRYWLVQTDIVCATGGGAVLRADNRQLLARYARVIYLSCDVPVLLARMTHSHDRPLLKTADPSATLRTQVQQRQPLYESIADDVVQVKEHHSLAQTVAQVITLLSDG